MQLPLSQRAPYRRRRLCHISQHQASASDPWIPDARCQGCSIRSWGFESPTFFDNITRGFRRYENSVTSAKATKPLIPWAQTNPRPRTGVQKSDRTSLWRRERDSNPRTEFFVARCYDNRFPTQRIEQRKFASLQAPDFVGFLCFLSAGSHHH